MSTFLSMPQGRTAAKAAMLILVSCLAPGCDRAATPYQPPLEGVFLWTDGTEPQELEGSTVEFQSNQTVVAQAGLVGDGSFMLEKNLPPGEYRLRIVPLPTVRRGVLNSRFQDFDKSGLTYTAVADAGPQRVEFKLDKGSR